MISCTFTKNALFNGTAKISHKLNRGWFVILGNLMFYYFVKTFYFANWISNFKCQYSKHGLDNRKRLNSFVITTYDNKDKSKYFECCYVTYRSLRCIGNPSSSHSTLGGGFPFAIHFRETDGPGWSVCSENLYNRAGMASEIKVVI